VSRILITGGAGFVGSNLAVSLASRHPDWEVVALDNLYRNGSELNLPRLEEAGVEFIKGDVREPGDLGKLPELTALIECSAEPSVMSGVDGDTGYLVHTNLTGAYNCLELARRDAAFVVFLSTSRVYPVAALNALAYAEEETRFVLADQQPVPGASSDGISEDFPLEGARTLYGATKLAAELLIEEYREMFGLRAAVNRCGVIAGPWQMGRGCSPTGFSTTTSSSRSAIWALGGPESRSGTCSTSTTSPSWWMSRSALLSAGTGRCSTSAAASITACHCWRRLRSAASSPARRCRSPPWRRAVPAMSPSTSPTARGSSAAPAGGPAARRTRRSRRPRAGSESTRSSSARALESAPGWRGRVIGWL
jgi:nucleoside-diphosphate-sugar epimerase